MGREKFIHRLSPLKTGAREVRMWVKEPRGKRIDRAEYDATCFKLKYSDFGEELYSVLKKETKGEAAEKVNQGDEGDGFRSVSKTKSLVQCAERVRHDGQKSVKHKAYTAN
jgi:hypothetical protein